MPDAPATPAPPAAPDTPPKRPPGRPRANRDIPLDEANTRDVPLDNPRHERFAHFVGMGKTYVDAYKLSSEKRVKYITAKNCASALMRDPQVRARTRWYRLKTGNGPETAKNAPGSEKSTYSHVPNSVPRSQPPADVDDTTPLSVQEIRRKAARSVRLAQTSSEISQAIKVAADVQPDLRPTGERDRPDPAAVVAFVASFAGMTGAQVAAEIGGLEFIGKKLVHVTKIPPEKWRDTFATLVRKDAAKAKKDESAAADNATGSGDAPIVASNESETAPPIA